MRRGDAETRRYGENNNNSDNELDSSASPRLRVSVSEIDWTKIRRVLVVRLRSIGDTVLATPALIALRRFLPDAQIDILLEDWVAPILKGFDGVDNVISFRKDDLKSRLRTAWQIRQNKYDVVFNLHGGTTSGFFVRATGAKHRVGFSHYRYTFFHNHLLSSSADFWGKEVTHSAEQQLALLGFVGIPVADKPKSRLNVISNFKFQVSNYALLHPVAAFDTKQWATENFARIGEYLSAKGFQIVAVATKKEREVLDNLKNLSNVPITIFDDLSLPEITALASRAEIFVGNDSGIAHIAAAVNTPSVVIFGSSNRNHWRPWTDAPSEIVYENLPCQPCAGYFCKEFDAPKCILSVKVESVTEAIEKSLQK
jgi:lipopolysaccharide heptosyltransferase II